MYGVRIANLYLPGKRRSIWCNPSHRKARRRITVTDSGDNENPDKRQNPGLNFTSVGSNIDIAV